MATLPVLNIHPLPCCHLRRTSFGAASLKPTEIPTSATEPWLLASSQVPKTELRHGQESRRALPALLLGEGGCPTARQQWGGEGLLGMRKGKGASRGCKASHGKAASSHHPKRWLRSWEKEEGAGIRVHHEVRNRCAHSHPCCAEANCHRFFPVNPLWYFSDYCPSCPGS